MSYTKKVAVVTGANRGLGFETCRQLAKNGIQVILTSRDEDKGLVAIEKLKSEKLKVAYYPLDVTYPESIDLLAKFIKDNYGRLDILVNNAGVLLGSSEDSSIFNAKIDTIRKSLETNVYGALQVCQTLIPLMKLHNYGRVVNVSSGMGQLTYMNGGYPGYRLSKTCINALTRIFADELKDTNILVNSVCPGWVRTDMGGPEATRTPEQGVDTIVWLAMLPDGSPSGGFYRDRKPLPW
ncbi:short-chain dehydrogenase/reductase SDR [Gloeothece citriformis PCC 7424]|uniref:Short-chain dehydrogenase/reductase SDR n=1 Tax=Gloeothece citriformis (strain PCC 7424) TaxID=65393 RepID=B7KC94_GLOC7|nr:SDR family oxidoreductase [Gloeothece citriformis]ACK70199.1 short-chain dehydrogenase/reductase SDR [Gloeothece citriformis PCC 7424]